MAGFQDFVGRGHVFLSYVAPDAGEVDRLQGLLQDVGIPVWRDTECLRPGDDRQAMIRTAIRRGTIAFIPCFSRYSVARRISSQNEELHFAVSQLQLRRPDYPWLIPVRFDDCEIPEFELGSGRTLASIESADLFGPGRDLAAGRLVAAVQRLLLPSLPLAPPLPLAAASAGTASWICRGQPALVAPVWAGKAFSDCRLAGKRPASPRKQRRGGRRKQNVVPA